MKLLRNKLIISFVIVVVIIGSIATVVGIHLIGKGIITQAQDKVRTDLNSAREIYQGEVNNVRTIVRLTAERFYIKDALIKKDYPTLNSEIATVRARESLDFLTLLDAQGRVVARPRNASLVGDDQTWSAIVRKALTEKDTFSGTEIVSKAEMLKCSPELAQQAYFKFIQTPHAKPTDKTEETSGMAIKSASPVMDNNGNLLGVLYGGVMINRNYKIVDKIKDIVFEGQTYKGKDIGTATIFQDDLRISTNVKTKAGERAIGTRIAADVGEQVLVKGQPWIERAFVVTDWYFTAYEPIKDIEGRIIGILYVGILEAKFVDIKNETLWLFISITVIGVLVALLIGYLLSASITSPIRHLVNAAGKIAGGDFNQEVEVESRDEIGELSKTFNVMIEAIKERDEKLKAETQAALIQMEKMSSLGQMAAGVAHEINNPLSGVLTYAQLMLKNIRAGKAIPPEELEKKLSTMEKETERCTRIIKSLLEFSRQSRPSIRPIDLAKSIDNALIMLTHQAELSNVKIVKQYSSIPQIAADPDQLQQVFTNIILNAIHAMTKGGTLTISTVSDKQKNFIGVRFQDTGSGITPENLKKLFTPFFTTKEKGVGIGLGLAVCYGIIQRHDGDIKVESEYGKGTTFTVWLKEKQ
ncbi:MAG: cache domain-containing protein [Planctomycetes bacterium]|nr:cache domain-containing protein [Planctomycetota bacterium]